MFNPAVISPGNSRFFGKLMGWAGSGTVLKDRLNTEKLALSKIKHGCFHLRISIGLHITVGHCHTGLVVEFELWMSGLGDVSPWPSQSQPLWTLMTSPFGNWTSSRLWCREMLAQAQACTVHVMMVEHMSCRDRSGIRRVRRETRHTL